MSTECFNIPADHPCLPGHFPDRPIVPAVVMLDEVIAAVSRRHKRRVTALARCKFIRPLEPGMMCEIAFETHGERTLRFSCTANGVLLASGQFEVDPSLDE